MWVRTTDFGDDKDRVIRRSNGDYTYFAADAAYYLEQGRPRLRAQDLPARRRPPRLRAPPEGARRRRGRRPREGHRGAHRPARERSTAPTLSKRAGNIIELDDLRQWLGTDALRYSLARYPADSPLTIDPEILQQAHERQPRLLRAVRARPHPQRRAQRRGIRRRPPRVRARAARPTRPSRRCSARCRSSRASSRLAAELREPHRVARYLEELAGLYHRWYDNCRVIPLGDEPVGDLHRTRLWLNDATGQVLRNGLDLLGVSRTGADVDAWPAGDEPQPTDAAPAPRRARRARRDRRDPATSATGHRAGGAGESARRPADRVPTPLRADRARRRRRALWITVVAIVVALVALVVRGRRRRARRRRGTVRRGDRGEPARRRRGRRRA